MLEKDSLIKTSRFVVRTGFFVNRLFAAAVLLGLVLSRLFYSPIATWLLQQNPGSNVGSEIIGCRLMMLVGIASSVAIDRLLTGLTQIIDSARAGDPFLSVNARRLRTIGWSLLALQLLDIPLAIIERLFPSVVTPDSVFSAAGWMAVLMVFVLSRVFTVGTAMRDDLEGTI